MWAGPECNYMHPHNSEVQWGLNMEEKAMWLQRHRLEWYSHKLRKASHHQKLKEAKNGFFPRASGGSTVLLTPWFWPSVIDFILLASRTVREYMHVALSYLVCGNFYSHHRKLRHSPLKARARTNSSAIFLCGMITKTKYFLIKFMLITPFVKHSPWN